VCVHLYTYIHAAIRIGRVEGLVIVN
jgi:hypothetical protein